MAVDKTIQKLKKQKSKAKDYATKKAIQDKLDILINKKTVEK